MPLPIDQTDPTLGWCSYFDQMSDYNKLIIVGAMIGAIEGLQGIELQSTDIIDYFERIVFREQTTEIPK